MKLAMILEGPVAFDGVNYMHSEGEGIYIDNIAQYFEEIVICTYAFHEGDIHYEATSNYYFKSPNIKFIELPLHRNINTGIGILSKLIQMCRVFKIILAHIKEWDVLYLFLPGYPAVIAFVVNKLFHKPYFVYLASDWVEESSIPLPWDWTKKIKIFYPFYYKLTEWIEKMVVKGSFLILSAGGIVYEKHKRWGIPIYETVPRLNWADLHLFSREDTCQVTPTKLLFVGYLLPSKGINYLAEGISILKNRGIPVVLTIVGSGCQREELENLAHKLGISHNIEFLGHIPNGPYLLRIYRESDIFILPTLGEGFPRVLYEAMSQSVPIVTTNVGGIPYKMKHKENALLIPPRSPEVIADAVEKLIKDGDLRRKLIKNGRKFMDEMIQNSDGGKQVHNLLKKHFDKYRVYSENISQACR